MRDLISVTRLCALAICLSGILTGCKKADAPQFSPAPGTYPEAHTVAMTSTSLGATIVYTTDGSAPSCEKRRGTIYSGPVPVAKDTTLQRDGARTAACREPHHHGCLCHPSARAGRGAGVRPLCRHYIATQFVTIGTATADATIRYTADGSAPTCATGTVYAGAIEIAQDVRSTPSAAPPITPRAPW